MKKSVAFVVCIFIWMTFNGQTIEKERWNALSLEVGKTGLIYSIAYDRKLKTNMGVRVTVGTNFSGYLRAFSTFCGGYYLVQKNNNNNFELGLDIGYLSIDELAGPQSSSAFVFPDYAIKTYYFNLNIGYRKYWNKSIFRIGTSPGYSKSGPLPGAYISYGLTF